ncbi:GNAT family N-acetyltransferase [Enterovibrio calviensis]|uniref:GNAT family N-acetyltransferase n=1 Tax=Enterovibrio calviensis TaxID=91359 RepID=UPI0004816159|nr:GNAT family N-acetyltransferase [Enterovibrio calviensis]
MNIIKATPSDTPAVAPLFNQYRVFYGQTDNAALAHDFINARLTHEESVIFFAMDEQGAAVGFTQLYPMFSSVSAQRIWVLNDLFVVDSQRGKGTGNALLNAAKAHAMATGVAGIALETSVSNFGAQKLYESLGYDKDIDHFHYFLSLKA